MTSACSATLPRAASRWASEICGAALGASARAAIKANARPAQRSTKGYSSRVRGRRAASAQGYSGSGMSGCRRRWIAMMAAPTAMLTPATAVHSVGPSPQPEAALASVAM